jgi:hypothetical protein
MKRRTALLRRDERSGRRDRATKMADKTTNLKLDGFSIEVEEGPATLLMQTDKGAFSVEMSEDQLSQLVYALRFVLYAQEPLRKRRERRQSEGQRLYASTIRRAKQPKGR